MQESLKKMKSIKKLIKKLKRDSISTSKLKDPKYISIEISEKCNLQCRICNQWKESNNLKKIEIKDIKKLIDEIKKYYPLAILEFSGPEPLTNKKLLLESLKYAKKQKVKTALSTNGTLLSRKNCQEILETEPHHISISLDGSKEKTNDYIRNLSGSFKKINQGIKNLVEIKKKIRDISTKISVTCVITNKNFKELIGIYKLCQKLKVDNINYNAYVPDNSYFLKKSKDISKDIFWVKEENIPLMQEQINRIIQLKEKKEEPFVATNKEVLKNIPNYFRLNLKTTQSCLAGYNYFHITNFGEVTVCGKGPYLNIRKNTIKNIWESKEFQKTRQKVKNCQKPCLNNCFRLK